MGRLLNKVGPRSPLSLNGLGSKIVQDAPKTNNELIFWSDVRPTPDPNRSCSTRGRVWDVYTPFALRSRDSGLWPLIENHNIYKSEHPAFLPHGGGATFLSLPLSLSLCGPLHQLTSDTHSTALCSQVARSRAQRTSGARQQPHLINIFRRSIDGSQNQACKNGQSHCS